MIGEKIAARRKELGMTQEQLGQLAGVSSQAVSKWEKGGAPDVELLPTIADRLGVTIDGLFGRDSACRTDMETLLKQWLNAFPEGKKLHALYQLLTSSYPDLCPQLEDFIVSLSPDAPCYMNEWKEGREAVWMRTNLTSEEGLVLGVASREFPMFLLLPEPDEGYERHFADNERYRHLFSALAQKGGLEILRYLYRQKPNYFTAASIAKRTGLSLLGVKKALSDMEACHLVIKKQVELEEDIIDVYMLHNNQGFVPFMYFARWLCEEVDGWAIGWESRERPILECRSAKKSEKFPEEEIRAGKRGSDEDEK